MEPEKKIPKLKSDTNGGLGNRVHMVDQDDFGEEDDKAYMLLE